MDINPSKNSENMVRTLINSFKPEALLKDKRKPVSKINKKIIQAFKTEFCSRNFLLLSANGIVDATTTMPSSDAKFSAAGPTSKIVKLEEKSKTGLKSRTRKSPHFGFIRRVKKLKQTVDNKNSVNGFKSSKGNRIAKAAITSIVAIAAVLFVSWFCLDMVRCL